jgi:release factor glutamine methyltransferase
MTKISEALENVENILTPLSNTARLDTQVLMAHVLQQSRTWVLAHPTSQLDPQQADTLDMLVERLKHGEAFPYVIGHWEFFDLDFDLTPDVLIPRPETELLVERAIALLQSTSGQKSIIDIGTGSGCIAISLAVHIPELKIIATDISSKALEVAHRNARKFHVEHQIEFIECDLLPEPSALQASTFNLICANLPYIPTAQLHRLPIYGREPTLALDGGADGLDLFRRLLHIAPNWLKPNGCMLLEIEASLGNKALSLAFDSFSEAEIHLHRDLTGRDRLLEIQIPNTKDEN